MDIESSSDDNFCEPKPKREEPTKRSSRMTVEVKESSEEKDSRNRTTRNGSKK